jgi:hypothetical protein
MQHRKCWAYQLSLRAQKVQSVLGTPCWESEICQDRVEKATLFVLFLLNGVCDWLDTLHVDCLVFGRYGLDHFPVLTSFSRLSMGQLIQVHKRCRAAYIDLTVEGWYVMFRVSIDCGTSPEIGEEYQLSQLPEPFLQLRRARLALPAEDRAHGLPSRRLPVCRNQCFDLET